MDEKEKYKIARQELASKSAQLTHYRNVTDNFVDKRSVLVEALSVWDTLLATRASEDIQPRSVACSARPHNMDGEAGIIVPREDSGNTPGEDTDPPSPPPNPIPSLPNPSPSTSPSNTTTSPSPQPALQSVEERPVSPARGGESVEGRKNHPQQAAQNSRPRQLQNQDVTLPPGLRQ